MINVTKKEIEIFGKVLLEIGGAIEDNPDILLDILKPRNSAKPKVKKGKEEVGEGVKELNIFEIYKDKKKSEIEAELTKFNREELKFLVKQHSLGVTRLNSVEKLSDFIADQVTKRTKDVFINQE